jgi:hypothetical protein
LSPKPLSFGRAF